MHTRGMEFATACFLKKFFKAKYFIMIWSQNITYFLIFFNRVFGVLVCQNDGAFGGFDARPEEVREDQRISLQDDYPREKGHLFQVGLELFTGSGFAEQDRVEFVCPVVRVVQLLQEPEGSWCCTTSS